MHAIPTSTSVGPITMPRTTKSGSSVTMPISMNDTGGYASPKSSRVRLLSSASTTRTSVIPVATTPVFHPNAKRLRSNQKVLNMRGPKKRSCPKVIAMPSSRSITSGTAYSTTTVTAIDATPKPTR